MPKRARLPPVRLRERHLALPRRNLRHEHLRLRHDHQPSIACKHHIRARASDEELAQERARGGPHMHAVAAAGVDVTCGVDLDAVRNSCVREGEDAPIEEGGGRAVDVVCVTVVFGDSGVRLVDKNG